MKEKQELSAMQRIFRDQGELISTLCEKSSIPAEFVGALIANETEDHPDATRFEPAIFMKLKDVREGVEDRYGQMHKAELLPFDDEGIRLLATSRGLTQIMGYSAVYHSVDPLKLADPETCLKLTLRILAEWAQAYWLDVTKDFEQLFRCWNTGRPDGRTYDPEYVPNGLRRMEIYRKLGETP
jgi:hypothetical protein